MEEKLLVATVAGFLGLAAGFIGWMVNYYLAILLRRRIEAASFVERQIGELYGPLLGLVGHSDTVYGILRKKLCQPAPGPLEMSKLTEEDHRVWDFFQEHFFIPINTKIRQLIRDKTHLLENGKMPDSFFVFLEHEAHYACLHPMWQKLNIDSLHVHGPPWPHEFKSDIEKALERLTRRHQSLIAITHLENRLAWSRAFRLACGQLRLR
jgi:hypothetical protein